MNELQEQILALLVAKFQGVRKDGLQHLAAAIGLQVATIEEANGVVDKLTADKVSQYVTDWRKVADAEISKANQTYENGLKVFLIVPSLVHMMMKLLFTYSASFRRLTLI